jgi:acyl-CoA synthetase (AMP-forming)/AMP-acid ligase II
MPKPTAKPAPAQIVRKKIVAGLEIPADNAVRARGIHRASSCPGMNIVDPILFQARYQPGAPALCALGKLVVSYAVLRSQMNNVARRAIACGLKRGSVVALLTDDPLLEAALILGLAQAGIVTMSAAMLPPPELKIDAVISPTKQPFAPAAQHLALDDSWITGDGAPVEIPPATQSEGDEVCRIVLTSGTTGDPKAVALTHKQVMTRNARFEYLFGSRLPTLSRFYMGLSLASSLGYYFLPYILGRGGTLFFRGASIENALRMFEVFRVEAMLASPAALAQLVAVCDQYPLSEVHFDTILSSGGLLPRSLVERVRPRLCSQLITAYGATETTISATAPVHRVAHIEGAAGFVAPGARIEIVDEANRPVPAGTEGIVRIASEFAVDRYIDDPVESARVFREGWFYPGDRGSLTPDNLLIISGRQNNILNIGGEKIAAEKIEAVLASFKGVRQTAVFVATSKAGVQELWAAVVCPEAFDAAKLRAHCRSGMPAHFVPAHIVNLDALPMSAMGKVILPRLKEIVAGGKKG